MKNLAFPLGLKRGAFDECRERHIVQGQASTFSVFCVTLALKKIPVEGFPNIKERKNGVLVVELKYVQNLATANVLLTNKYRYCANGFYGAGEVVLKLGHNF